MYITSSDNLNQVGTIFTPILQLSELRLSRDYVTEIIQLKSRVLPGFKRSQAPESMHLTSPPPVLHLQNASESPGRLIKHKFLNRSSPQL